MINALIPDMFWLQRVFSDIAVRLVMPKIGKTTNIIAIRYNFIYYISSITLDLDVSISTYQFLHQLFNFRCMQERKCQRQSRVAVAVKWIDNKNI